MITLNYSDNSSLLSREYKKKRPQSLSICVDLSNSLQILRQNYKKGGHYERLEIVRNAERIKKKLNKEVGQYKIYCKEGLDDFGKTVVDCLF